MYLVGAGLGAQHVQAGRLRALAVSSAQRLQALPDTPTFREVGLSGIQASNWWGVAVPKGTPPEVVQKLYEALRAGLASEAFRKTAAKLGIAPLGGTPEE